MKTRTQTGIDNGLDLTRACTYDVHINIEIRILYVCKTYDIYIVCKEIYTYMHIYVCDVCIVQVMRITRSSAKLVQLSCIFGQVWSEECYEHARTLLQSIGQPFGHWIWRCLEFCFAGCRRKHVKRRRGACLALRQSINNKSAEMQTALYDMAQQRLTLDQVFLLFEFWNSTHQMQLQLRWDHASLCYRGLGSSLKTRARHCRVCGIEFEI